MAMIDIPLTMEALFACEGGWADGAEDGRSIPRSLVWSIRNRGRVDLDYMSFQCGASKDQILEQLVRYDMIYQNPEGWDGDPYSNWELASEYLSGNLYAKLEKCEKAIRVFDLEQTDFMKVTVGDRVAHKTFGEGTVCEINLSPESMSARVPSTIRVRFAHNGERLFRLPHAFMEGHLRLLRKTENPFARNIEAIKRRIPKCISIDQIHVQLGSPWLDTDLIDAFIRELFGTTYVKRYQPSELLTAHESITGAWTIPNKSRYGPNDVKTTVTYGTKRLNALHLIEKLKNNSEIIVYDYSYDGKRQTVNRGDTIAAIEKANKIEEEFEAFLRSTPEIRYRVEQAYYRKYGSIIQREFNGDIFEFPGMNPSITLFPYQRKAFARCVLSPNTLLAHDVGAGKTFVMIAAAMELRRMGISKRNLFVVPNSIVGQWADFFLLLYPAADILVVGPKDFTPKKRNATLARIRDEDHDAILIAYSCFDRLMMSRNTALEQANEKLAEVREALKQRDLHNIPALRNLEKRLKAKVDRLIMQKNDPNTVYFDDLGINTLFIDEIHNYKRITVDSRATQHAYGISRKGSAKNDAMLEKIRYVQQTNGGRGIIAATGTPITNSITDLYAIQLMLQSGELALADIHSFDDWLGAFTRREENFELDVDTSNFRNANRYNFHNIPELAAMFSSVADFYTVSQEDLPSFDGYEEVIIPMTVGMIAFNHAVSKRADAIHHCRVKKEDDNFLKLVIQSMQACLDLRLVNPNARFTQQSKVYYCARNVARIYNETKEDALAQLVFCDLSTPKKGFNLYDELKRLLVTEFRIPAEEIAFVHDAATDAARSKLFARTKRGEVRVLIGSTKKLGTGTNVQDKLVAVHHLDVPWSPADMNQREGRILRNGNTCKKIHIYRYIVQNSFDAYSYQLLQTKQRVISDILKGCIADRDSRDVDSLLSYAEIKSICIGREELKRRFEAENQLSRYRILQKKADEAVAALKEEIARLEKEIPAWHETAARLKNDADSLNPEEMKGDGKEFRTQLNELVLERCRPGDYGEEETLYACYHGFDLVRPRVVSETEPCLLLKRKGQYTVSLKPAKDSALDPVARINNTIRSLPQRHQKAEETIEILNDRVAQCRQEIKSKPNYEEEIRRCIERIEYYERILQNSKNGSSGQ